MLKYLLAAVIVIAPYVAFQAYGYYRYCNTENSTIIHPWCNAKYPHLYAYVQAKYWNNGFLKYFKISQLPNFLLAAPIFLLSMGSVIYFFARYSKRTIISLGLLPNIAEKKIDATLVIVVYQLALTLYCLFMAHVQIMTRFLASSPPL